jgi:hypothetical protein
VLAVVVAVVVVVVVVVVEEVVGLPSAETAGWAVEGARGEGSWRGGGGGGWLLIGAGLPGEDRSWDARPVHVTTSPTVKQIEASEKNKWKKERAGDGERERERARNGRSGKGSLGDIRGGTAGGGS